MSNLQAPEMLPDIAQQINRELIAIKVISAFYPVVSTKNCTKTERAYRIEKQRLLVGTCQVVTDPTGPDTGDA